ncbi:MAG: hypothetical protein NUV90_02845 [Candidatus Parcubacteria bacterium]|nr:hypothetical protein [Candidatus Parcubacteria bacterium]
MSHDTTAISLFKRFLPKFREITWIPAGFRLGEHSARYHFAPKNKDGYSWYDHPDIDIKVANLAFTLVYNPASKLDPTSQMLNAMWEAITVGPFAGRKFYAEPVDGEIEKAFDAYAEGEHWGREIPIKLSYDGDKIPGLHLVSSMSASSWKFFIPEESPEGKAIAAALAIELAKRQEMKNARKLLPGIYELETRLSDALATVPA